ncbi:MAG TPA: lysine--tRNA ligase [Actinocrinis sp.]|nr:lysine--tRNA ligase [Actinocrinis sp.]
MAEKQPDWVAAAADTVIAEGKNRNLGGALVCASGISPSGPIHLGNLREIMVPHFVADEIRRRGLESRHILSWDDYDRFRKVPAGFPASFAEHIGRPLTSVPDPCGEHENWAEHFKEPFRAALRALGVEITEISQSQMYTSGAYREQILLAMRRRRDIDAVLGAYRTKAAAAATAGATGADAGEGEADEAVDADDAVSASGEYFPYKPYCQICGRDTTTVLSYDDDTTEIRYSCACGHSGGFALADTDHGKLVWKVDWPMRWAFEGVTFEAGGVDHSSPGSSFTVGQRLVREIFGGQPPVYLAYSFVGTGGAAKMSGSAGGAPTPSDALAILEPQIVRWLYVRRRPNQAITVSFDQEVGRLYDEWDALGRRIGSGASDVWEQAVFARAAGPAAGALPATARPFAFRVLASLVDVTAGDEAQILRILRDLDGDTPIADLDQARPRLDCARAWITTYVPADARTHVREEPDGARLAALTEQQREAVALLLERLEDDWSQQGLTTLVYGVPKVQAGLPADASATPELKAAQRALFTLLYQLLVGSDTGPRLPTLLLALGPERIRTLLAVG